MQFVISTNIKYHHKQVAIRHT